MRRALVAAGLAAALGLFVAVGVRASDHPTRPADLGRPASSSTMDALIDQPGPLTVESVVSADWKVDRSGLINLGHPTARAAVLRDGLEPIELYLHVVRHPTRGRFLIDTGVERALRDDPSHAAIRGMVADAMHAEYLHVRRDTALVVAAEGLDVLARDHPKGRRHGTIWTAVGGRAAPFVFAPAKSRDLGELLALRPAIADGEEGVEGAAARDGASAATDAAAHDGGDGDGGDEGDGDAAIGRLRRVGPCSATGRSSPGALRWLGVACVLVRGWMHARCYFGRTRRGIHGRTSRWR